MHTYYPFTRLHASNNQLCKRSSAPSTRQPKSAKTSSANTPDSAVNQPSCENEVLENECMNWDGSLNHFTVEELEQSDTDDEKDADDSDEFSELEGDELLQSFQYQEREQAAIGASSICRRPPERLARFFDTLWQCGA